MKGHKTKLLKKLESLKKKEATTIPFDSDALDQEIDFEGEEKTPRQSAPAPKSRDLKTTILAPEKKRESSEEDGTAVLSEIRHLKNEEESFKNREDLTHREITAGRELNNKEKVSYGDVHKMESQSDEGAHGSVEGLLKQAEHLRLAQEKINDLENELEELRRENDEIMSVADTFKTLSEEYYENMERLKADLGDSRDTAQQENRILKDTLQEKDRQLYELKQANADLKSKVEANFKQIRKRERDLEYRLELIKAEEATLLKTKDKSILELRRRIDKMDQEMEAYREKNKEHYEKLQQQQQTVRGVVRALRIALTRLEGDFGVDFEVLKKAE